jgi:hypothetical protein
MNVLRPLTHGLLTAMLCLAIVVCVVSGAIAVGCEMALRKRGLANRQLDRVLGMRR